MLTSLAYVLLLSMALGALVRKLRLSFLAGMLLAGILPGPRVLNLFSPSLLGISMDLRQLALAIILTRAGLSLELEDLRQVERPTVLLCFVPASFEVLGMILLAPRLLGVDVLGAAIMGAVVGAVSPAVIVSRMLRLMKEGCGADKGIPQMILVGASMDDVSVIVLFTSSTGVAQGGSFSLAALAGVSVSIVLDGAADLGLGYVLAKYSTRFYLRDLAKVVVLLALAFLLVAPEDTAKGVAPFSELLAILGTGLDLHRWRRPAAERLTAKFGKPRVAAGVVSSVLVGAEMDIGHAAAAGLAAVAMVLGVSCFRTVGMFLRVAGGHLSGRERLFAVSAYLPRTIVQAAIGGVPLAMGLACGQVALTVVVVAILVTAPLGTLAIDLSFRCLLRRNRGWRTAKGVSTNTGAPPLSIQDALGTAWCRRG